MATKYLSTPDIRVANLTRLMNEKFDGRQVNLARAIDTQAAYISRVLQKKKGFGEEFARKVEVMLDLPNGWLDDESNSTVMIPSPVSRVTLIPCVDGESEGLPIRLGCIGETSETGMVYDIMGDDSMSPTVPKGDVFIVDSKSTAPVDGLIYSLNFGNTTKVRRMAMTAKGQWVIRCDNTDKMRYQDVTVEASELAINGRVIWSSGLR